MTRVRQNRAGDVTRFKILDAAEQMFGESGFDGVSLREITQLAQVDLAMVNYHFRSKENLFAQVLARRASTIGEERTALLRRAEQRASPQPVSLDEIVSAFLRPVYAKLVSGEPAWLSYARLIAQVSIDPRHAPIVAKEIDPHARVFLQALQRSLSQARAHDVAWGYLFMAGGLVQCLARTDRISRLSAGRQSEEDFSEAFQALHGYTVAGLQSLASRPAKRREYSARSAQRQHA